MASSSAWRPETSIPAAAASDHRAAGGSPAGDSPAGRADQAAAQPRLRRTSHNCKPHEQVTVSPGRNGYALVETQSGARGYVSASDLQGAGGSRSIGVTTSTPAAAASDVRTLAGSNAARRDDFAQSVAVTEKAEATGFELAV